MQRERRRQGGGDAAGAAGLRDLHGSFIGIAHHNPRTGLSVLPNAEGPVWMPAPLVDHSVVNAMMALPRLESIWTLPPAPTTMYCLPPTA